MINKFDYSLRFNKRSNLLEFFYLSPQTFAHVENLGETEDLKGSDIQADLT